MHWLQQQRVKSLPGKEVHLLFLTPNFPVFKITDQPGRSRRYKDVNVLARTIVFQDTIYKTGVQTELQQLHLAPGVVQI